MGAVFKRLTNSHNSESDYYLSKSPRLVRHLLTQHENFGFHCRTRPKQIDDNPK
jgi:hypothetical protein